MNILDLIVIVLIGLYFLNGFYRGFIPSLLNIGAFLVSWLGAFFSYGSLSRKIVNNEFISSFQFYIEGAEKVNDFEAARRAVSTLSETDVSAIMDNAKLPNFISKVIESNIKDAVFADQGIVTVGDYFNMSIYYLLINIISFIIIFFALRCIFMLLTNAISYSADFPQLKLFDHTAGGVVSLLRGFFAMHIVFMIVPFMLLFMPTPIIDLINSATATSIFYSGNILLPLIKGIV